MRLKKFIKHWEKFTKEKDTHIKIISIPDHMEINTTVKELKENFPRVLKLKIKCIEQTWPFPVIEVH